MKRRSPLVLLLAAGIVLGTVRTASAFDAGKYRFAVPGRIAAVRAADINGDGRSDLVLLMAATAEDDDHILILRSATQAARGTFFPRDAAVRMELAAVTARAGVVCIGRFGPKGETRLRFLGPDGITDANELGTLIPRSERHATPTLFRRGPGRALVFYDGVADLNGDGKDEVWFPHGDGNGAIHIMGGTPSEDRVLALEPRNRASTNDTALLVRHAYVPRLTPADLDGDGQLELIALKDDALLVFAPLAAAAGKPVAPAQTIPLPFLKPDPTLPAEGIRAPRVQLEDVDGDGTTDLLVSLISGRRDELGSLRTTLFHYPGPFVDKATGKLVKPKARIDTEAVALHPTFVDLDGDGDKDYVGDSIRASLQQLIAQVAGRDPALTYVGFRFDGTTGTFESTPAFTLARPYSNSQTMGNQFGRAGWFGTDFDGDGFGDLLDLGNLSGVTILRGAPKTGSGPGDPISYSTELMPTVGVKDGLAADGLLTDLDGDGRTDAVLYSEDALYLVVPKGAR